MDEENKKSQEDNPDEAANDNASYSDPDSSDPDGSDPDGSDENSADDEYFIKKAVFRNYEVAISGLKLGNPAEILEKLYPLRGDNTITEDEKIEQVHRIILEYME